MRVTFNVPGEPQGKARAKTVQFDKTGRKLDKPRTYTPDETVLYENLICTEYRRQCGARKFESGVMLDLRILAYYAIPESASKKKKKAMETGEIRPTKKPDADNVLKVVADSLNQIAYHDDAQVVDTQVRKFYSYNPRLDVSIQSI